MPNKRSFVPPSIQPIARTQAINPSDPVGPTLPWHSYPTPPATAGWLLHPERIPAPTVSLSQSQSPFLDYTFSASLNKLNSSRDYYGGYNSHGMGEFTRTPSGAYILDSRLRQVSPMKPGVNDNDGHVFNAVHWPPGTELENATHRRYAMNALAIYPENIVSFEMTVFFPDVEFMRDSDGNGLFWQQHFHSNMNAADQGFATYSAVVTYVINQPVWFNGELYLAKKNGTLPTPSGITNDNWEYLGGNYEHNAVGQPVSWITPEISMGWRNYNGKLHWFLNAAGGFPLWAPPQLRLRSSVKEYWLPSDGIEIQPNQWYRWRVNYRTWTDTDLSKTPEGFVSFSYAKDNDPFQEVVRADNIMLGYDKLPGDSSHWNNKGHIEFGNYIWNWSSLKNRYNSVSVYTSHAAMDMLPASYQASHEEDTTAFLRNPRTGIQSLNRPAETFQTQNSLMFPGTPTTQYYGRDYWVEVHPDKNVFNHARIDARLEEAMAKGQQFHARIMCGYNSSYIGGTPPWYQTLYPSAGDYLYSPDPTTVFPYVVIWDSETVYSQNDVVGTGGGRFISLVDNNQGVAPPASVSQMANSHWERANSLMPPDWVSGNEYQYYDTVAYNGAAYSSTSNFNTTTPGADPTKWRIGTLAHWDADWDSQEFLDEIGWLIDQYGARYDGHPYFASMDIGIWGTWGQQNAVGGIKLPGQAARDAIVARLQAVFPNTPLIASENYPEYGVPSLQGRPGDGWRQDGHGDNYTVGTHIPNKMVENPGMFDNWKQGPVAVETYGARFLDWVNFYNNCPYSDPRSCVDPDVWIDWLVGDVDWDHPACDFPQAPTQLMCPVQYPHRATYYNAFNDPLVSSTVPLMEKAVRRLGYRLFFEEIRVNSINGTTANVSVVVRNSSQAAAPPYDDYFLALRVVGEAELRTEETVKGLLPGDNRILNVELELPSATGQFTIEASLFAPDLPEPGDVVPIPFSGILPSNNRWRLEMANSLARTNDGFYPLLTFSV